MTNPIPPPSPLVPQPGEAGVQFNPPPDELIGKVKSDIARAVAAVGRDFDIAAVAVADRKGGWNTAVIANVGDSKRWGEVDVLMWIGKTYGTDDGLDYGAQVMWTKKF